MSSNTGKYLNQENIIKKVFDGTNDALKVNVVAGSGGGGDGLTDAELRASPVDVNVTTSAPTTVVIDAADDSIAIGDRTTGDLMTVNPDGTINVNIEGVTPVSGRIPVDLGAAVVNITGPVTIPAEVEVKNDSGNPLNVQATNLDIRDLAFASDKVDVSNSTVSLSPATLASLENVSIDNFPASQNVVVTSSALPTGAATSANQSTANVSLASIDSKLTAPLAVTGPLTDAQLRASAVPVSLASVPLASDASTLSEQENQTTHIVNIENNTSIVAATVMRTIAVVGVGNGAAERDQLVGGVYKTSPPTLVNGDQSEIILNSKGHQVVEVSNPTTEVSLDSATIDQIKPLDVQPAVLPTVTETDGTAVGPGVSDEFIKIGGWDVEQAEYRQAMFRNEALIVNDSRLPANLGTQPPAQSLSTSQASGFQITRVLAAPAVNTNLLTGVVSSSDWYDAIDYNHIAFSIQNTIGSGVVQFEMSDDPSQVTGMPCPLIQDSTVAPAIITQFGLTAVLTGFSLKLKHRYFRIRISTTTAGTVTLNAILKQVSIPDSITITNGSVTVGGSLTTVSTVTTVSGVTAANLAIPGRISDTTLAAVTTTTTTAGVTPTFGCTYQIVLNISVVSGTNPTYDLGIEESYDGGVSWIRIYDMPRITTTGQYFTPEFAAIGQVRYVQTISGTTPSFTRQIQRLQGSGTLKNRLSQIINRTVDLTTLNSVTPSLRVHNSSNVQLVVNVGAIVTTAPALQLEGSDDVGASWYSLGAPLTAVASSTVRVTIVDVQTQLIRARVSTAGIAVTPGYVLIKGF